MTEPTTFRAELDCSACGNRTEHKLSYAGRLLAATECMSCGHLEQHDRDQLAPDYLADLGQRIVSKPRRMARRLQRERGKFVLSMPGSIAKKPLRMIAEVRQIVMGPRDR